MQHSRVLNLQVRTSGRLVANPRAEKCKNRCTLVNDHYYAVHDYYSVHDYYAAHDYHTAHDHYALKNKTGAHLSMFIVL